MSADGRLGAVIILGAALAAAGQAGPAFGGTVSRVSAASTTAGLELRIFAAGFFDSRLFLLEGPNRIILDISGVGLCTAAPLTEVNESGVRSVRTSQFTADVVRIVVDLEGRVPTYKFSRIETGFLILFPRAFAAEPPALEIVKPKPIRPAEVPAKTSPAAPLPDKTDEKAAVPETKIDSPQIPVAPPVRAQSAPAPASPVLRPSKVFRVTAAADLFLFRDAALAEAYGRAANYGGRLDVQLLDFGAIWVGADYYGRKAAATGGTRTIRIVPIEAGIKFIMSRGALAPYIGFGAAYFLFREETPAASVRLGALGLISTAGILLRLGPSLALDGYVRYRRLPVDLAVRSFDAGGFHFGGGLGLAF